MQALRQSLRQARPAFQSVRRMSTSVEINFAEEAKEANKWKLVSFAALPVILGMIVMNFSGPHPHFEPTPNYPYMHIRNKPFPWGEDGLFEVKHH